MRLRSSSSTVWRGLFLGLFALVVLCGTQALAADSDVHQRVRVIVDGKDDVRKLMSEGRFVDCGASYNFEEGYVQLELSKQERELVKSLGYDYIVDVPDLESFYASRSEGLTMGGFRTFSEVVAKMDSLHNQYPALTRIENIGTTHNGNTVWAMKVSDNVNMQEDEPEVLYTGLTHAREPIGMEICLDFVEWLLDNYGSDPDATLIVNERQVWIIPVVNPDGYLYNQQTNPNGGGMWRKNRRNNGGNYGVDINRNYTYMWGYDNNGSSPYSSSETYRGPSAGSEPETQAVMDFCEDHEFVLALHYHSYGEYFIYPFGYDQIQTPDHALFVAIADSSVSFHGYDPGQAWQLLYAVNGDAVDYSYGEQTTKDKIFGFTPEVGDSWQGFWPSSGDIPGLVAENHPVNKLFALIADNPYSMVAPYAPVIDPMGTDPDGNYTVSWQVVSGDQNPDKFELQELSGVALGTDGAEDGTDNWQMQNFTRSSSRRYAGNYSFYSGTGNNYSAIMTSATPVTVESGMSFSFRLWYDTESNYDYGYVEISTDGNTWDRLERFDGSSGGWVYKSYSLNSYIGEQVYFRFRYSTDVYIYDEGFYVDEIYPVQTYASIVTLDDNIQTNSYDIYGQAPGVYEYRVRGHNQNGWGPWSATEDIEVTGSGGPVVDIDMIPNNPPVNVPRGGYFLFTGILENTTQQYQLTDVWIMLQLPGGAQFGPLQQFNNVWLSPGQNMTVNNVRQDIPGYAPLGTYDYISYCGDYPSTKVDSASFPFTVTSAMGGDANEWTLYGWNLDDAVKPAKTELFANYPNPFNANTTIGFDLANDSEVRLEVYNLLGQNIATLFDGRMTAGHHSVNWDASTVSSGVYFYKLTVGDEVMTRKMNLLK
ncbi:MAG: T9SS type A sorting domain-containing protein [candidate division Zixibacteria bacterium]|nr:T9SS type A sorting domain-containing protein [candidate division Zixibacteria bacterium]